MSRRRFRTAVVAAVTALVMALALPFATSAAAAAPSPMCVTPSGWKPYLTPHTTGDDADGYLFTCHFQKTDGPWWYQATIQVAYDIPADETSIKGCGAIPPGSATYKRSSGGYHAWGWGTTQNDDGTLPQSLEALVTYAENYAKPCDDPAPTPTTSPTTSPTPAPDPTSDPDPATGVCPATQQKGKVRVEALDSGLAMPLTMEFRYIVAAKRNTRERILIEVNLSGAADGPWQAFGRGPLTDWGRASATRIQSLALDIGVKARRKMLETMSSYPNLKLRFWVVARDTEGHVGRDCAALDLSGLQN